tara:strand:+ start:206 stop:379 length:174 start_codon:yes stop_codon:yes gene_type:complete
MPKPKKKSTHVKPITDHNKIQIDIKKNLDDEKQIKPEKVFEGYKKSKTSSKNKKSKY